MEDDLQYHLQGLEISTGQSNAPTDSKTALMRLQLQVAHLQRQLQTAVKQREVDDMAFMQAAQYAGAKGSANGVLHALFDQASAGKTAVLKAYVDSGSIPTRDGLRHWRLDIRGIRNEAGATLLHAAVGVSTARQNAKVKLVHLLVDRVGFDPNVRNVFGQTPLHVAAMGGYPEVVRALLERGADPIAQDRSGLTALSLVHTLSRPPEEVVQILVDAESAAMRKIRSPSDTIPLSKALASALFLRSLSRFTRSHHASAFAEQTTALVTALLEGTHETDVAFDQLLQEQVPMLFDVVRACQTVHPSTIFASSLYLNPGFIDDLRLEADGYGLSLVSPALTYAALAGPIWTGMLLKLIQRVKVEMAELAIRDDDIDAPSPDAAVLYGHDNDEDVRMQEASSERLVTLPSRKVSRSSSLTSHSMDSCSELCYADQATRVVSNRQAWCYAVLFKASTHAFPGTIAVTPDSDIAVSSEDVSKYFPLEDRLLIGSAEYFATGYNPQTREFRLDRRYDGKEAAVVKAYLTGSCSSLLPPYVALKQIWERKPGNKYEDQMSGEQELYQDYQFLHPESEYEAAIKLGPIPNKKDAKTIVAEWKRTAKQLFDARECKSGLACCEHYCPQRNGHSLCVGTLAVIGQGLAKRHLGRPTFYKPLKPRASLQRLQDRFKGAFEWPGSPSQAVHQRFAVCQ
ncbi:unnamed protein product [Hyaloperonospora brassicae]|uniref:Uncharacterized protein n=1 Tax=Hyaloperonospora brassicae TaxID=162125 RepID=A0AAV0UJ35_HYABA|nr:unnamed protein product [Hyaloperonospora brassicae]